MADSRIWKDLSPEEKTIRRREYRKTYKERHPERVKEFAREYKERNKAVIRVKASIWQKQKGRENKLKAIEYLGGCCIDCKQTFPPNVYDFHHLDPSIKETTIARIMGRSWKNIIPELDKCVLLCANCHRLRHGDQ